MFEGIVGLIRAKIKGRDWGIKDIIKLQRDCVMLIVYLEYLVVDENTDGDDSDGKALGFDRGSISYRISVQESIEMDSGNMGRLQYEERVKEFAKEVASVVRDEGGKRLGEIITQTFGASMASHLQNYNQVLINSEQEASKSDFGHNLEIFINPWQT